MILCQGENKDTLTFDINDQNTNSSMNLHPKTPMLFASLTIFIYHTIYGQG
jgi:hypothetical protein